MIIVKDVLQNLILYIRMVFVNVIVVMLIWMVHVYWEQQHQLVVMLVHSLIINYRNVYHVQMDVWVVKIVMIVHNVDLIIILMLKVVFVIKYVVMVKDIHFNVMMVIMLIVMVVVEIVIFKLDSLALEVHQIPKILVLQFYQLKF